MCKGQTDTKPQNVMQNYTNNTQIQIYLKNNYLSTMKTLYIILFLSLVGCMSANKLYEKSIKKGYTPEKETIEVERLELVPIYDTITNEIMRTDTVITRETRTVFQDRPITKWEYKTIRDTIRITERAETRQIKHESKAKAQVAKHENKRSLWWLWVLIGGVIGVFGGIKIGKYFFNRF